MHFCTCISYVLEGNDTPKKLLWIPNWLKQVACTNPTYKVNFISPYTNHTQWTKAWNVFLSLLQTQIVNKKKSREVGIRSFVVRERDSCCTVEKGKRGRKWCFRYYKMSWHSVGKHLLRLSLSSKASMLISNEFYSHLYLLPSCLFSAVFYSSQWMQLPCPLSIHRGLFRQNIGCFQQACY